MLGTARAVAAFRESPGGFRAPAMLDTRGCFKPVKVEVTPEKFAPGPIHGRVVY